MKVLLATSLFAPEVGGVPRLLWQICQHRPAEWQLRVLSVRQMPPDFYAAFDSQAPFPIERVAPLRGRSLTSLRVAGRLAHLITTWQPDVIFCGVAYPTAILARLVTRALGTPYVILALSEDVILRQPTVVRALSWTLRGAHTVLTISAFTQRALLTLGADPARVRVLTPGVEWADFDAPPLTPRPPDEFHLLTVARLIDRKGQDTVLRALPRIAERVPGVRYTIAGLGPHEAALQALAVELGVADRVTFAGFVADAALPALYAACDVFVMPTREAADHSQVEGFGLVYLEAGAAGKPVIGGRAGGVPDAVLEGETGLLVDPLDVDALAQAVVRLAHDPALAQRLGQAGRARARGPCSAENYVTRVAAALAEAAHRA